MNLRKTFRRLFPLAAVLASLSLGAQVFANNIAPFETVFSTDYVVAGVGGMRNIGSGTITVSGISGTVKKAYLYWHGPTNSNNPNANATVTVNGQTVVGTNIGFSDNNCWGFNNSQAYRAAADITPIVAVQGNGVYNLSNFLKPNVNVNGASLIVFFDDGNNANNRDVVIFDGNDSNIPNVFDANGWNVTLPGINYTAGTATMQLHVADGQDFPDGALILNNVTLVPAGSIFQGNSVPSANNGPGNNGSLWDIKSYDVTAFLTPGVNTLSLRSSALNDCLSLVVALIDLPAGAAPEQPDDEPPVVNCPASIVVGNDTDSCGAAVNVGTATATDNKDTVVTAVGTRSDNLPLNAPYPVGLTTITWTATDAAGNVGSCMQTVTVNDVQAPSVVAPPNVSAPAAASSCSAAINPGTATANDNCPGVTVMGVRSDSQPLNAPYPVGTTTITWTATDAAGHSSSATQTVTVNDTQAPVISGVAVNSPVLWPPNHRMELITVGYTTTDNCGSTSGVTSVISATSNEPDNGLGDGDTAGDIAIVDNHHLQVRAERSGKGSGRIYTITITATDGHGNTSTQTATVSVPKSQGK